MSNSITYRKSRPVLQLWFADFNGESVPVDSDRVYISVSNRPQAAYAYYDGFHTSLSDYQSIYGDYHQPPVLIVQFSTNYPVIGMPGDTDHPIPEQDDDDCQVKDVLTLVDTDVKYFPTFTASPSNVVEFVVSWDTYWWTPADYTVFSIRTVSPTNQYLNVVVDSSSFVIDDNSNSGSIKVVATCIVTNQSVKDEISCSFYLRLVSPYHTDANGTVFNASIIELGPITAIIPKKVYEDITLLVYPTLPLTVDSTHQGYIYIRDYGAGFSLKGLPDWVTSIQRISRSGSNPPSGSGWSSDSYLTDWALLLTFEPNNSGAARTAGLEFYNEWSSISFILQESNESKTFYEVNSHNYGTVISAEYKFIANSKVYGPYTARNETVQILESSTTTLQINAKNGFHIISIVVDGVKYNYPGFPYTLSFSLAAGVHKIDIYYGIKIYYNIVGGVTPPPLIYVNNSLVTTGTPALQVPVPYELGTDTRSLKVSIGPTQSSVNSTSCYTYSYSNLNGSLLTDDPEFYIDPSVGGIEGTGIVVDIYIKNIDYDTSTLQISTPVNIITLGSNVEVDYNSVIFGVVNTGSSTAHPAGTWNYIRNATYPTEQGYFPPTAVTTPPTTTGALLVKKLYYYESGYQFFYIRRRETSGDWTLAVIMMQITSSFSYIDFLALDFSQMNATDSFERWKFNAVPVGTSMGSSYLLEDKLYWRGYRLSTSSSYTITGQFPDGVWSLVGTSTKTRSSMATISSVEQIPPFDITSTQTYTNFTFYPILKNNTSQTSPRLIFPLRQGVAPTGWITLGPGSIYIPPTYYNFNEIYTLYNEGIMMAIDMTNVEGDHYIVSNYTEAVKLTNGIINFVSFGIVYKAMSLEAEYI